MIACMKDGMSKHAQHTLKDGQINQKLKLTLGGTINDKPEGDKLLGDPGNHRL